MTSRPVTGDVPVDDVNSRAIRTIFADLEVAFSEHDASKFDSRFTSDIILTAVNGQRFYGWDDIHSYHKERLENHADGIRTWYKIDTITFPAPTVAIAFVRQPVVTSDGERSNVGTWVLTKKSDGWWVCAIQNTGVAAPPIE